MTLLAAASVVPLCAEDGTFTFNMGGGITTPLNPTGQYAGTSGNCELGAGYKISDRSSISGEFMKYCDLVVERLHRSPLALCI